MRFPILLNLVLTVAAEAHVTLLPHAHPHEDNEPSALVTFLLFCAFGWLVARYVRSNLRGLPVVAFLFIGLAAGCGKPLPPGVTLGDDVRAAGIDGLVTDAAADLFAAVKLDRSVTITTERGATNGGEGGHACIDCSDCRIVLNVNEVVSPDMIKGVLYHEFGHCKGMQHTTERGVMYPATPGYSLWSPEEVQTFVDSLNGPAWLKAAQ